jgi:hypothetical protein
LIGVRKVVRREPDVRIVFQSDVEILHFQTRDPDVLFNLL